MPGTRSPSPRAPVTEALIVAHGQPSDPAPAEAALHAVAKRVSALLPHWHIRSATMAASGRLEREVDRMTAPLVFPLFMSDGWFTQTALPARLNNAPGHILAPLGLDPTLPAFASRQLLGLAAKAAWNPEQTEILVAAHGSGGGRINPAQCTRRFADAIARLAPWQRVQVGFLEEAPQLSAVAAQCDAQAICIPFFAADGFHVSRDIPKELEAGGFAGQLGTSVGIADYIPDLIAGALQAASIEKAA